jgi:hypothetical protein
MISRDKNIHTDMDMTGNKHDQGNNQYSETNVMHFLFNLLRIKGLYMFRALLAHPQEALRKRHLVYCERIMSVAMVAQPTDNIRTQYTKGRLRSAS